MVPISSAWTRPDVEHRPGDGRGQNRRDHHADGRQQRRRAEHQPERRDPRAQAAVEQDQRQGDRADEVGEAEVGEADAERAVLAGDHADHEEDEQQRSAEPRRQQAGQDPDQHQGGAEQDGEAD